MILDPLNDDDCLRQVTAHAVAAMARPDVRELAARLGSTTEVVVYLRRLPQREDGPEDTSPGPRIQCDVAQRVRANADDPNCVERSLLYLALAELLDPYPARSLITIEVAPGVRHTFPVEDNAPVWLDPIAVPRRNALAAGVHQVRNARGEVSGPLAPLDALAWAVNLAGDAANTTAATIRRHAHALDDVQRIAKGLAPTAPAALTWALGLAVPEALAFGPDGHAALLSAAGLLDDLAGTPSSGSATPPAPAPRSGFPRVACTCAHTTVADDTSR